VRSKTFILIIIILLFPSQVFATKVLRGRDFFDYVEVRKERITAPLGKSVHWVFVWNHKRSSTVLFKIPSDEVNYWGATIKFEPQPFFYKKDDRWALFIKRKGYIKITIYNPGVNGEFSYSIPCSTIDEKQQGSFEIKIFFIGPQGE